MSKPFDLPPDEVRRIGYLAADAVAEHRAQLTQRPVFGKVGAGAAAFDEPVPEEGQPFEEVLAFAREHILPFPMGNSHPRFYGFINATADPVGITADYLAAAMNPNCWGGDHAAIHVEHRVMRWLAELLGFPPEAEGILVSGGSMANFTALAAARRAMTPGNVREDGLAGTGRPRLTVYASDQVHSCVDKAVDLLGIGTNNLRKIPSDAAFRLPMEALVRAVAEDRRAGLLPAIVVGNAGTVNTGAIDPLGEIADFCKREGLWFHADGAYGAMARISASLAPLLSGLERADSIAADPHKWLYVPYEAGATLVREPGRLSATFRKFPEYLASDPESPVPRSGLVRRARRRAVPRLQGPEGLDGPEDPRPPRVRGADRERRAAREFSRGGGGPAPGLRAAGRFRALDCQLPVSPGGAIALRRRARPRQPPHRQPPRRRRLLLPRAHDPEGPSLVASVDHELQNFGG